MTTRQANLVKHSRRCLKCGKPMWTDRCHRVCVACSHHNEGLLDHRVLVPQELRHWLRGYLQGEASPAGAFPNASLPALAED